MNHPIYTVQQLSELAIASLKKIASEMGIVPEGDKRSKQSWIDAIIAAQPQLVAQAELNTESDIIKENCVLEPIGKTEGNTQTVYKAKHEEISIGLIFHIHASNTWQCCDGKDYKYPSEAIAGLIQLQKNTIAPTLPLPVVGDTHFIGDFRLECTQYVQDSEYAAVWNVFDANNLMGEIRMGWDCFWTHPMSFVTFATPQEAVVDLYGCLQTYQQEVLASSEELLLDKPFTELTPTEWEQLKQLDRELELAAA